MRCALLAEVLLGLLLVTSSAAGQNQFGEYWPVDWGCSWEYSTSASGDEFCDCGPNPPASCRWDVLGQTTFGGQLAWQLGRDNQNFWYVTNDGATFSFLGGVFCGYLDDPPDTNIGAFSDGSSYTFAPGTLLVLRMWDQLDPNSIAGVYGIDPDECDVVVWVWYDTSSGFAPNAQNTILESGGGTAYPFAVTELDFVKKDVGPIGHVDVDAANGNLGSWYDAVGSFDCNANLVPDHLDISNGTSMDLDGDGVPDGCGQLEVYCTAKLSSVGCAAAVLTSDPKVLPVSGAADYSVTACNVHPQKAGLLFGSTMGAATIPFSGGVLCVRPPLKRGPLLFSGGSISNPTDCDGFFSTTVNTGVPFPFGLDAASGTTAWYQFWYRDTANGLGNLGTALSNAIRLDFL